VSPYYQDSCVTIYHASCMDVMASLGDRSVGAVITDPPFHESTMHGARTRKDCKRGESKALVPWAITRDELMASFREMGRLTQRWVVSFLDYKHVVALEEETPEGLRFVRFGIWVKPNSAPQFTGDRPASGWEGIAIMHRAGGRMRWNGGGNRAVWTCSKVNGEHPTEKPEPLVGDLVTLFSDREEVILDPYMGSGTTLRCAKDRGRRAIGVDLDERCCEMAAKKMSQEVLCA
jgi:site-specific DNA-methyltransferase (adenine-specific)